MSTISSSILSQFCESFVREICKSLILSSIVFISSFIFLFFCDTDLILSPRTTHLTVSQSKHGLESAVSWIIFSTFFTYSKSYNKLQYNFPLVFWCGKKAKSVDEWSESKPYDIFQLVILSTRLNDLKKVKAAEDFKWVFPVPCKFLAIWMLQPPNVY